MNRLVYLFELDAAKVGRRDAENAEFTVFNEIIKNGNKVVMSMNQFVDSRLMTSAVYDEENYKYIRRLFDDGAIKVALYADVCSVSQYVQSAIDRCISKPRGGYIFSTLPVKANDTEMLKEIKNALQYSDLTNLNNKLDDEYVKLRYETNDEIKSELLESIRKLRITLRFLSLVLRLSVSPKGNNPAKATEGRSFMEFMDAAREILNTESFRRRDINACKERVFDRLSDALEFFRDEELSEKQINRRTTWLNFLNAKNRTDMVNTLAVEIVNLCYNYAVQDTIHGASKQYDDYKFEETFRYDFIRRVNRFWTMQKIAALDYPREDEPEYKLLYPKQWKRAVSISGYNADYHTTERYDTDENPAERMNWYALIMRKFGATLGYTAAYVGAFCIIGFIIDLINKASSMSAIGLLFSNLGGIVLVGVASVVLSMYTNLPNAFDCAFDVGRHVSNIFNAAARKYDLRNKK